MRTKSKEEIRKMLLFGVFFSLKETAPDYIKEANTFQMFTWRDAHISRHGFMDEDNTVRVFIPQYRTIVYRNFEKFMDDYNKGYWKKTVFDGTRSTLIEKIN